MEPKWHAVYTRNRWEKKVAELLEKKGIENYCPLNAVVRQWSDRKKRIYEPLFNSYVFVRIAESQLSVVKEISGVINLVHWLNKPAVIRDYEIQAIKDFLRQHETVRLEPAEVNVYDAIRVLDGPLSEYEGSVLEVKNNSVKVMLPSLGYMMVAEVQKSNVEVITSASLATVNTYSRQYAFK